MLKGGARIFKTNKDYSHAQLLYSLINDETKGLINDLISNALTL